MAELWCEMGVCGWVGVSVLLSWRCLGDLQVEVQREACASDGAEGQGGEGQAGRPRRGSSKQRQRRQGSSSSGGHLMPLDLAAGVIISHILVRGQLAERWAWKGEEEKGREQRRWGIGLG